MTDSSADCAIPNTNLTKRMRALWECMDSGESWEDWYARHSAGGTPNGRAIAAVLFDRALCYWPDFFSPADRPALAVWGDLFDDAYPFATPDIIEQAVDLVAASGVVPHAPFPFLQATEQIMRGGR